MAAALADLREAEARLAAGDESSEAMTAFWSAVASLELVTGTV